MNNTNNQAPETYATENSAGMGEYRAPTETTSVLVLEYDQHGFSGAYLLGLNNYGRCRAGWRFNRGCYSVDEAIARCQDSEVGVFGFAPVGGVWVKGTHQYHPEDSRYVAERRPRTIGIDL